MKSKQPLAPRPPASPATSDAPSPEGGQSAPSRAGAETSRLPHRGREGDTRDRSEAGS